MLVRSRDTSFLPLFALANAGAVVAYVPLLTLLLPAKIAALAGAERVEWLGAATIAGAVAASVGNIAFGWASDLAGTRRRWAAAGLALTIASYALLDFAQSWTGIIAAVVVYQLALNMMLAPLAAWAADEVPDDRKGLLGGLLGAAPPIGGLAGVFATLPGFPAEWMRLALICLLSVSLTAPLLLLRCADRPASASPTAGLPRPKLRSDFALLWTARLLVQVAGGVLFAFVLYYFQSQPESPSQSRVAIIAAATLWIAFPIGLVAGRYSDRIGRRKPFLIAAAAAAAAGLIVMSQQSALAAATAGYALFGCSSAVFLALHSGYAMQLLPSAQRRGRDLGVLNLTNTIPAIVAPLLALAVIPRFGFEPLMALLSFLVVVGGLCVLLVRHDGGEMPEDHAFVRT